MFKNILDSIQTKIDTIKKENDHYKELLNQTTTFKNLYPINITNLEISEHKTTFIINDCPDLNKEKAQLITKLIPITETILTVIYTKEIITNLEYYLVATDKYLWVINQTNYGAFSYNNITVQIIKNNMLSKTILLNNILLEANGSDTKIRNFINLLNEEQRSKIIKEKTNYLCNITPIYQKINSIGSGISIDNQSNIVFHTKNRNFKYHINNLENFEILLDNQSILGKNSQSSKTIGSFQNNFYQITIRITTKDKQILIIPILEPNSFGTKYQRQDTIFQTNLKFAQDIINKLIEISPKNY